MVNRAIDTFLIALKQFIIRGGIPVARAFDERLVCRRGRWDRGHARDRDGTRFGRWVDGQRVHRDSPRAEV